MSADPQSLADRIRDGATGYSADMAKAMGWKAPYIYGHLHYTHWIAPDGTRHASCPDYEGNPRFAFEECVRLKILWAVGDMEDGPFVRLVVPQSDGSYTDGYIEVVGQPDPTRAINEALCRAKGV